MALSVMVSQMQLCRTCRACPHSHPSYGTVMLKVTLNPTTFSHDTCQFLSGRSGDTSENQSAALGISNLKASYWPLYPAFEWWVFTHD